MNEMTIEEKLEEVKMENARNREVLKNFAEDATDEAIQRLYPIELSILGASWRLLFVDPEQDGSGFDRQDAAGFCSPYARKIVLREMKAQHFPDDFTQEDKIRAINKTLRHEIIHAYLYENGLDRNASSTTRAWPKNEEMVDWFAIQGPKIVQTWKEVGCDE